MVEGLVRPKQDRLGDTARERVIPILIHGDAAFAGQGVVAETLNLSQLEGYTTGGTIHLVINNQIGFTTNPNEARSTPYSTDVARMVQAPIFHVNGDDPDACLRVAQMAYDYRQTFKRDVVIDMFCYRRHGHNEGDDPSYTQPILYRKIRNHPPVATLYSEALVRDSLIDAAQVEQIHKGIHQRLNDIYDASKQNREHYEVQELSAVDPEEMIAPRPNTAVDRAALERVVHGITTFPDEFHVHPKLEGFLKKRQEILRGAPIDWATAETLAFGTLVLERTPVRLSGQDSGRGTFSQRHLELYDSETGDRYIPLQHLSPHQARFDVFDSSLSEYAVMGFEFGYSVADPLTLVLWEAQFGDFANGAQILIDQFIASAESKWGQPSGLVLLLPHGYEGQGPEHSSARIERFLTLCAEDNMQVVNASTPAQYFHLLRRQMHGGLDRRGMRKPLIVFTPKRMLRHPKAVSSVNDLMSGSFREVIDDTTGIELSHVSRVLICSGQVYYDVLAAREQRQIRRRHRSAGADLSVPGRTDARHSGALSGNRRRGLGAGRAAQHGRLAIRAGANAANPRIHAAGDAVCGPCPQRQPGVWFTEAPSGGTRGTAGASLLGRSEAGGKRAQSSGAPPAVTLARLSGSADGSQPPQQEKMVAAKRAAVGPQNPVDGLLHDVANAYAL